MGIMERVHRWLRPVTGREWAAAAAALLYGAEALAREGSIDAAEAFLSQDVNEVALRMRRSRNRLRP